MSGRQASVSSEPGVQDTRRHVALSPYPGYWLPAYQLRGNWTWPSLPLWAFQRSGSSSVSIPCCSQKQSQQGGENEHHEMHALAHDLNKFTPPHPSLGWLLFRLPCCWVGNFWAPGWKTAELTCGCNSYRTGLVCEAAWFLDCPLFHLAQEGSRGGLNSCHSLCDSLYQQRLTRACFQSVL